VEISSPKILATFVVFKKPAKVNNRPTGEISPKLVTLLSSGPGLPDGLFSNQKSKIWVNFGGL
jgi:hypothetical protein